MCSPSVALRHSAISIGLYAVAIGGAFIASAVCPVLTPLSALAIGVIFGTSGVANNICKATIASPIASIVARLTLTAAILTVGFVAMKALALPVTVGAVFASIGFIALISIGIAVVVGGVGVCAAYAVSASGAN